MVGFFQKLFGKKEIEIKVIKKKDLAQLCKTNVEKELREFSKRLEATAQEIAETIKNRCDDLKSAVLKNPNIPARAKHIMDGNRDTHIKQTLRLVEQIKIREISSSAQLCSKLEELSEKLTEYTKSTQKSYTVLQEFFKDESDAIAAQLKRLSELIERMLQDYAESSCKKYEEILSLLEQEEQADQKNKDIGKQVKELKSQLENCKKDRDELESKLKKIIKSDEYSELQQLKQKLDSSELQSKQMSRGIKDKLSSLSRPLKKYSKITLDTKTVESLLADPAKAIQKEEPQKILEVMQSLLKSLEQDKIDLKETVKKKAIVTAKQIDLDWIIATKRELELLNETTEGCAEEIGKSMVESEIGLLKKKIAHCDERLGQLSSEIAHFEKENKEDNTSEIELILKKLNFELE